MNPKELVAQFVEEKLEGDINRLATFPWAIYAMIKCMAALVVTSIRMIRS